MVMNDSILTYELKTRVLNYWTGLVGRRTQKVNLEDEKDSLTIEGVTTEAGALYGKNGTKPPYFAAEQTSGGTEPVHFVKVSIEVKDNTLRVRYQDETEVGPSYVGSSEMDSKDFAEKCGLKLQKLESNPEKGEYTAVFA